MFRITTLNVNGIRSAEKKGLSKWVELEQPDVLCLQEVKAQQADIPPPLLQLAGLTGHFYCAQKKGYAGVALYSKERPQEVICGFGEPEFDDEGRYLEARFKKLTVISAYFPSGSAGPHRQESKFRFLKSFLPHLKQLNERGQEVVLCGDVNIAHQNIDLKNWRSNQKNSGFLPEERAWLTQVFDELGLVDVFRRLDTRAEQYTWWSNRGQAWANNVGWRIDYQIATPGIAANAKQARIYKTERFSDHAPLSIDYEGTLN